MSGSGFAFQAIRIIAENRRLKRRKKIFDYRDVPDVGLGENKKVTPLTEEEKQELALRLALAKRKGILHEVKMYALSLAIFALVYWLFQMIP